MKSRCKVRPGVAATELAILLPFLVLAMAASLDFARVFHATQVLESAAGRGSAALGGTTFTAASAGTTVEAARAEALAEGASLQPPLAPEQITISQVGNAATLRIDYDFPLITAVLIPEGSVRLQRTVTVRVVPNAGE